MIDVQPNLKYGIMLSGGLDSAVLLYVILKNFTTKKITPNIQPFTIPKADGANAHAIEIVNFMNQEFDVVLPEPIIVGDTTVHHSRQGVSAVLEIRNKYSYIDKLFFGSNKIPSVPLPGIAPKRLEDKTGFIIAPFWDLYKTDIIRLALRYDIQELFNITHTCTEQAKGRCNKCWQCNERAWAFKELGKFDTGHK